MLPDPVPGDVMKCLSELGVEIVRADDATGEIQIRCPVHFERTGKEDRHPSAYVNAESGLFTCFSCGWSGGFTRLVRDVRRVDQDEAVSWVRAHGSIDRVKRALGIAEQTFVQEIAEEFTEADLALFEEVPEDVCESRNLAPWAVDQMGILWDPRKRLWITPIRHPETGRLWGWQEKNKRYFRNVPKFLNKADTLFGLDSLPDGYDGTVIVVESPLDCPRILTAGITNALPLAVMGFSVSPEQAEILCRFDTVISALDNDPSGDRGNRRIQALLSGRTRLKFWDYDDDTKDPGDQTDEQILASYQNAFSNILARW